MLKQIIKDAVEVYEEESAKGYVETLDELDRFANESADIYISKLSVQEEWSLLEELNQKEPVADFGIGEEKTLGQAITSYVESTLTSKIRQAVIDAYYNKF